MNWTEALQSALLLGAGFWLSQVAASRQFWRDRRARRLDDALKFDIECVRDCFHALDSAYEAAVRLALNVEKADRDAPWSVREPFVMALGSARFDLRRNAAMLAPSPQREAVEAHAQRLAALVGEQGRTALLGA